MFCEGRLRLGRRVFELEEVVEYERPLLSLLLMRVATSMEGGGIKGEAGNGCCCSCTSDMALPERYDLLYRLRNIVGKRRLPNSQYIGMKRDDRPTLVVNAQRSLLRG